MGTLDVKKESSDAELRQFTRQLLNDVKAMERMIQNDMFETGVRRIGAEQEFFLVDRRYRPAPIALELLEKLNDAHYTPEIARFNLEFNLDPLSFSENCLSTLEEQLRFYTNKVRDAAAELKSDIALVGILPTIRKSDLTQDQMMPFDRYYALDRIIREMRGENYHFRIKGIDELMVTHESVMLEACNTSFQLHFQVSPEHFAKYYNFAQFITAPILSVAVNSPLLFGRRLWKETRIALFQQAVDTRGTKDHYRQRPARVSFGSQWLNESVLELFKDDVSRYRVIFGNAPEEDSLALVNDGQIPKLHALNMHNGTVYRWNRPCYGIYNGKPHLRIENRVLPAGPTILDEVANAAFFFGLMGGFSREYEDIRQEIEFGDASLNFTAAARHGLDAKFHWFGKKIYDAGDLVLKELLPMARYGLEQNKIQASDIDRYLGIIEERAKKSITGSSWMLGAYKELRKHTTNDSILSSVSAALIRRQKENIPVHDWKLATEADVIEWTQGYFCVDQFMTTDIFTVFESDPIDLVANLMDWQQIKHVPVENKEGQLVGLVTYRHVIRQIDQITSHPDADLATVGDIMRRELITIHPETTTLAAINLMQEKRITCLPVVDQGQLVGIVTETDFVNIASKLLREKFTEDNDS